MSRQPRAGAAGKLVGIRAAPDERARWERCAALVGLDLSGLIRRAIDRECKAIERRSKKR